jgi:hypothetical protein
VVGARVEALRAGGLSSSARRLAAACARGLRKRAAAAATRWARTLPTEPGPSNGSSSRATPAALASHTDPTACASPTTAAPAPVGTCALTTNDRCLAQGTLEHVSIIGSTLHQNFITDSPYWMGYPLEAVWFIFDCLAEACIVVEDPIMRSPRILPYLDSVVEETHPNIPPRYFIKVFKSFLYYNHDLFSDTNILRYPEAIKSHIYVSLSKRLY